MKLSLLALASLLSAFSPGALSASQTVDLGCAGGEACRVASDAELGGVRAGFLIHTPGGALEIRIGITRAVAINDRLVAVSHLVLPDASQIVASAQSQAASAFAAAQAARALARSLNGTVQPVATASPKSNTELPVTPQSSSSTPPASGASASTPQAASSPVLVNGIAPSGGPVSAGSEALVVQNGAGNLAPALSGLSGGDAMPTIVQNSLNDQVLRTVTLLNASVSSLTALKALALADLLGRATAGSGR